MSWFRVYSRHSGDDLRDLSGVYSVRMSTTQEGAKPFINLKITAGILKSVLCFTRSQWRDVKIGTMCSNLLF